MSRSAVLVPFLLPIAAVAQTVWQVPSGASLEPYIAQAVPGDVLQLGASHPAFVLDRGLTLLGPSTIQGHAHLADLQVPAGQQAHLVGLTFDLTYVPNGGDIPTTVVVDGDASLVDCTIELPTAYPATYRRPAGVHVLGGDVALIGCTVTAPGTVALHQGHGLWIDGGHVAAVDSTFRGGDTYTAWTFEPPFHGVLMTAGTLQLSDCSCLGGLDSVFHGGGHGIALQGGTAFLSSCTLRGGDELHLSPGGTSTAGGAGLSVTGGAQAFVDGVTATGGAGVPPGPAQVGAVTSAPVLGVRASGSLAAGHRFTVTAAAVAAQPMFFVRMPSFAAVSAFPVVEPVWGLASGDAQVLAVAAAAGPGALVAFAIDVPANLPVPVAPLFLQVLQWDGAAWHASPPVGGVAR